MGKVDAQKYDLETAFAAALPSAALGARHGRSSGPIGDGRSCGQPIAFC